MSEGEKNKWERKTNMIDMNIFFLFKIIEIVTQSKIVSSSLQVSYEALFWMSEIPLTMECFCIKCY